jgi:hypothetical protein
MDATTHNGVDSSFASAMDGAEHLALNYRRDFKTAAFATDLFRYVTAIGVEVSKLRFSHQSPLPRFLVFQSQAFADCADVLSELFDGLLLYSLQR